MIEIGDIGRFYDFPGMYIEGEVLAIGRFTALHGSDRYEVLPFRMVFGHRPMTFGRGALYYAPINGRAERCTFGERRDFERMLMSTRMRQAGFRPAERLPVDELM